MNKKLDIDTYQKKPPQKHSRSKICSQLRDCQIVTDLSPWNENKRRLQENNLVLCRTSQLQETENHSITPTTIKKGRGLWACMQIATPVVSLAWQNAHTAQCSWQKRATAATPHSTEAWRQDLELNQKGILHFHQKTTICSQTLLP